MQIHTPPMTFRDEAAQKSWALSLEVNTDPYGNAILRYASEWATQMERKIAEGATVRDCADQCSHSADDEGITGFMYGCAVSLLAGIWIHGEALRRWHNSRTQIGNEGEVANENGAVLNPALITINNANV